MKYLLTDHDDTPAAVLRRLLIALVDSLSARAVRGKGKGEE